MNWFQTTTLVIGVGDAALIMLGGIATAIVILAGWDAKVFWDRTWPATAALVVTNIVAVLILLVVHKLIS